MKTPNKPIFVLGFEVRPCINHKLVIVDPEFECGEQELNYIIDYCISEELIKQPFEVLIKRVKQFSYEQKNK